MSPRPRRISSARSSICARGAHAFGWQAADLDPSGTVGDATRATAALGARTVAHQTEAFIALLTDVDRFDLTRLA